MVSLLDRSGSRQVLGGVSLVALSLGGLLVAYQLTGVQFPEWVYFGLLWLGTFGGATVNGYRDGGVAVSCLAAGIGVAPMALAFAPSGPPGLHLTAVDLFLKAGGWMLVVGVTVGCLSHGIGLGARRLQTA